MLQQLSPPRPCGVGLLSRGGRTPLLNSILDSSLRAISISRARWSSRDRSSIDFAYMPQYELESPRQNEIFRVPILPSNSTAPVQVDEVAEPVHRPEITTVSADGTHIDNPSAMSEVTDNHALDLSPFDLTSKVTNAAATATSKTTGLPKQQLKQSGVVQEFLSGLWNAIFAEKKSAKA